MSARGYVYLEASMMSWSEVDWLEVAGCLVLAVPALVIGVRHLRARRPATGPASERPQGQRALYWGLGMTALAAAAMLESGWGGPASIAGIAVAVVFFVLTVLADRNYRRARQDTP
jgi:hypothetical protein